MKGRAPGQEETLFPRRGEVVEHITPVRNMSSKNAFSRLATPEYWSLDPESFSVVDEQMIEAARPANLRRSLIDVSRDSQFAVDYRPAGEPQSRYIALTPQEYGLITRNVSRFDTAVIGRTLSARPSRPDFQADREAAERSGAHALKAKKVDMETYLHTGLEVDLARLGRIAEAVRNPGFWRMREGEMRIEVGWIKEHIFGDMFTAIRSQRLWTPEQEELARLAVDWRLFFDRKKNQHLGNWATMIELNTEYIENKKALFSDRIWQVKRQLRAKPNGQTS